MVRLFLKISGFVPVFLFLILPLLAIAADRQFPAKVMSVDMGELLYLKPSEKVPEEYLSGELPVLFENKEVGKVTGFQWRGDELLAFFKPLGDFSIKKGMSVVLFYREKAAAEDQSLILEVTSVTGEEVSLSAGESRGVKVGNYFRLTSSGIGVAEVRVENVEKESSRAKVIKKFKEIVAGATASRIPPPKDVPQDRYLSSGKATGKSTTKKGPGEAGGEKSAGEGELGACPVDITGSKVVADGSYLRYDAKMTNRSNKTIYDIEVTCKLSTGSLVPEYRYYWLDGRRNVSSLSPGQSVDLKFRLVDIPRTSGPIQNPYAVTNFPVKISDTVSVYSADLRSIYFISVGGKSVCEIKP